MVLCDYQNVLKIFYECYNLILKHNVKICLCPINHIVFKAFKMANLNLLKTNQNRNTISYI